MARAQPALGMSLFQDAGNLGKGPDPLLKKRHEGGDSFLEQGTEKLKGGFFFPGQSEKRFSVP